MGAKCVNDVICKFGKPPFNLKHRHIKNVETDSFNINANVYIEDLFMWVINLNGS